MSLLIKVDHPWTPFGSTEDPSTRECSAKLLEVSCGQHHAARQSCSLHSSSSLQTQLWKVPSHGTGPNKPPTQRDRSSSWLLHSSFNDFQSSGWSHELWKLVWIDITISDDLPICLKNGDNICWQVDYSSNK